MPLFLAGLLVRGGVLAPEQAEEALQRQALLGGALDTSLLELGSIAEDDLVDYLARASGLPAPAAGALDGPLDPALREVIAARTAERYGVVPFRMEDGRVHVACSHPADGTPFDELAPGAAEVVAHVAPEVRVRMAIERLYGSPVASRFHELAARLDRSRATEGEAAGGPEGSVEDAFSLLGSAADRDDALAVLLRFARQRFELVAALAVSGRTLVGWDALGTAPDAAARIKGLSLSVDEPSVLRLVLESKGPYLGPVGDGDLARKLEEALGRRPPHVALVLPIVVANRTVALLFAENGHRPIGPAHVEQVMHVAQAVGPALEKLIRARKSGAAAVAAGRRPSLSSATGASAVAATPPSPVASPSPAGSPSRGPSLFGAPASVASPAPVVAARPASAAGAPPFAAPTSVASPSSAPASAASPSPAPSSIASPARAPIGPAVDGCAPDLTTVQETLRLPPVARRRTRPVDPPLEPARLAVERALAARTEEELDAAMPALREVAAVAAELLVSLLPSDLRSPEGPRAAQVLRSMGASALPALAIAAASPSRGHRLQAARIAASLGTSEAAALLSALASDEDAEVAAAARSGA
ncbi:MAG TPA: hypothetical protein VN033_06870 [Vulgatibacter sp.]|nr:hypothetical protein [Vulgatibacter sp.]